jgi:hypothetical protein
MTRLPGDMIRFRCGRDPVTKNIIWTMGLVITSQDDQFDLELIQVLHGGGVRWIKAHGTERLSERL